MSVLLIEMTVQQMLIVLTLREVSNVSAEMALRAMEKYAEVSILIIKCTLVLIFM